MVIATLELMELDVDDKKGKNLLSEDAYNKQEDYIVVIKEGMQYL